MDAFDFFLIPPEKLDSDKEKAITKNLVRLFKGTILSKRELRYLPKEVQKI